MKVLDVQFFWIWVEVVVICIVLVIIVLFCDEVEWQIMVYGDVGVGWVYWVNLGVIMVDDFGLDFVKWLIVLFLC